MANLEMTIRASEIEEVAQFIDDIRVVVETYNGSMSGDRTSYIELLDEVERAYNELMGIEENL